LRSTASAIGWRTGGPPYDPEVDSTTQAFLAGLLGSLVVGAALLAWAISDRQLHRRQPVEEPTVPAGVATVLSVLRSSAVVVDENDLVVKASAPAYAMGFVRGTALASEELGALVEAVRRDFIANVSHELKTPVGAIQLLAEAVEEAADDPEAVKRFADRMSKESTRLAHLVQQVIELSRLQGDEPLESPAPVPLEDVIAVAVDTSAIDAGRKQITVVADDEPGLAVLGNEEQVAAAVANLVANAVHYSDPGAKVLVTTRAVDTAVEISVVDQGIGIPEGEIERIFERFYRVDPARHRSTGGTGLGLSIVKHVAATHGGEVRVWSAEGQGSTFTLSLPRHQPPSAPSPVASGARTDLSYQEDQQAQEERP
jgi:two-component system sensor histidine kinase SenX3